MRASKRAHEIWTRFRKGEAPSEIDKALCLRNGTARYEITCIWSSDKEEWENGVQGAEGRRD